VDVAAAQTCAVRAVPVTFYDHRSAAAGAGSGKSGVHEGSPLRAHCGPIPRGRVVRKLPDVPITGLPNAYGVS
jgi:hypothetical protein